MTGTGVAVIGGGPCGVAAAVQVHRSGVPVLLFEKRGVGGLLHNAQSVENYPGIPKGLPGPEFCLLLARHLAGAGVTPLGETITEISPQKRGYLIQCDSGKNYSVDAVIMATGTRPNPIEVPWKNAANENRLFYEVRDLPSKLKGEQVAIIGAGDAAYDYALNVAERGGLVSILQRGTARCLPLLAERVAARKQIEVHEKTCITRCSDQDSALSLELDRLGEKISLHADYLLVACGRSPEDGLLQSLFGQDPKTMNPADLAGWEKKGLFAGGDLVRGICRQAGIAVGDGLVAAMRAIRYINGL